MSTPAYTTRLPDGTNIGGRYRIVNFINHGGFGNTYRAIDTRLADDNETVYVVIKEFFIKRMNMRNAHTGFVFVRNPEDQKDFDIQRRKFIREAKRIYRLRHPGIVRVTDIIPDENGTSYYVMDYIPGQSLSALLHARGPLPEAEAVEYIRQLLSTLIMVHGNHMLHLDIKPGNIMLDKDGRAVLIDFGTSKVFDVTSGESSTTSSAPIAYTPRYAPTEQMLNELKLIGPATDLYAVGATLYRLLTNSEPPSAGEILRANNPSEVFHYPLGVSSRIQSLVTHLMAANIKDRPGSAQQVYDFLTPDSTEDADSLIAPQVANPINWYQNVFADPDSLDTPLPQPLPVVDAVDENPIQHVRSAAPPAHIAQDSTGPSNGRPVLIDPDPTEPNIGRPTRFDPDPTLHGEQTPKQQPKKPVKRSRTPLYILGGTLAASVVLFGIGVWVRSGSSKPQSTPTVVDSISTATQADSTAGDSIVPAPLVPDVAPATSTTAQEQTVTTTQRNASSGSVSGRNNSGTNSTNNSSGISSGRNNSSGNNNYSTPSSGGTSSVGASSSGGRTSSNSGTSSTVSSSSGGGKPTGSPPSATTSSSSTTYQNGRGRTFGGGTSSSTTSSGTGTTSSSGTTYQNGRGRTFGGN
ncbi:MAG: protein kinase [Bacteroidaceae bacterium]|nr:protein kinase [Bacteroidaceae bacterium]